MAQGGNIENARYKGMLELLQGQDEEIDHIVAYSKFVVAYLLQQDGPNPGWRKANIEGPVYLVRRRSAPRYQLLVKNQFSTNDLLDTLHPEWELDCQKNYVFYKVEDASKRIRGLWFHDDAERLKLEQALEKTLEEVRNKPAVEPQPEPSRAEMPSRAERLAMPPPGIANDLGQSDSIGMGTDASGSVMVTKEALRSALHGLADDSNFLNMVMKKLEENQNFAIGRTTG
jgi:hypothetical protein